MIKMYCMRLSKFSNNKQLRKKQEENEPRHDGVYFQYSVTSRYKTLTQKPKKNRCYFDIL